MVGYAAFSTNLVIQGTSSISSNWQVEITGVSSQNIVGNASNNGGPVYSPTAVTFNTILETPGDSIDYVVTVTNNGTIAAKLNNIEQTEPDNPAITYTLMDIEVGVVLQPTESKTFTVRVAYDESVTTQPDEIESSLTIALDFVQNS